MHCNNVFQYSKIRTRKRNAKKSIKTVKIWNPVLLESGIHSVESRIQECPGFPYMGRIFTRSEKKLFDTSVFRHIRKRKCCSWIFIINTRNADSLPMLFQYVILQTKDKISSIQQFSYVKSSFVSFRISSTKTKQQYHLLLAMLIVDVIMFKTLFPNTINRFVGIKSYGNNLGVCSIPE